MVMHNPYATYQNNTVTTSSPGELTLMLYNGCLKFIQQAKQAVAAGNIEDKNTAVQKAQAIISELMITLDVKAFPAGKDMLVLYEFANSRLIDGNIKNDIALFDEAAGIITEFRDTWKQVIQLNRQKQYGNVSEI
ncbi:flagellar protein FliS [Sporosarcina sp. NCCP-2716]|uniref:flagellar export chaperone FliS n=1 Tax=Sporosarcina sp. NCCP-2716 TaxID=2943679 RepID=UPI00203A6E0E|nr:flagellar export chaperone FliS [Sporosarcina sp. NCCP-2716]GKV67533.1 flagellar protein FliS [Sporosarcina sp. NCCP-2716]